MKLISFSNRITGRAVGLFAVVFLLFVSALVSGETLTKVSTLDELIKMFDSSSCKECHEKVYEQWEKSHHARPLIGMDDMMLLSHNLKGLIGPTNRLTKLSSRTFRVSSVISPR